MHFSPKTTHAGHISWVLVVEPLPGLQSKQSITHGKGIWSLKLPNFTRATSLRAKSASQADEGFPG